MNSIQNNFVPYQIALDMKSIGFDEPCFGWWFADEEMLIIEKSNKSTSENVIQAPIYQQAFRWFREKYELIHWLNDGGLIPKNQWYFTIRHKNEILPFNWVEDTTYEHAEQECLNKLIQIAKEDKK
jgi:hypothetical protein